LFFFRTISLIRRVLLGVNLVTTCLRLRTERQSFPVTSFSRVCCAVNSLPGELGGLCTMHLANTNKYISLDCAMYSCIFSILSKTITFVLPTWGSRPPPLHRQFFCNKARLNSCFLDIFAKHLRKGTIRLSPKGRIFVILYVGDF